MLAPTVVAVLLVVAWQFVHVAAGSDTVSSPLETLGALAGLMQTARFWLDVAETGQAFVWALLLSMVLGIALGVALGLSRPAGRLRCSSRSWSRSIRCRR